MFKHILAAAVITAAAASTQAAENSQNTTAATSTELFLQSPAAGGHLASKLIGASIYTGQAQDAQSIGEINDLIIAQNGDIDAVIVGVGGFLGMGEKNVALNYDQLTWGTRDGGPVLIAATTKEALDAAPSFDVAALDPANQMNGAQTPAPADQMAAQQPMTPAPAMPNDQMAAQNPPAGSTTTQPGMAPMPDSLQTVDVAGISANNLINTAVYSIDNENVGEVSDVILATDGTIDAVVLDVGGFLGLGEKPVSIAFDALNIRRDANGALYVYTQFSREQLEAAPNFVKDRYPAERDSMRLGAPS